jgi:hypothetical protein
MLCRISNRLDFSCRCITPDTSVSSLSFWERAGVRAKDVDNYRRLLKIVWMLLSRSACAISGQLEKPLTLALSQRERGLNGGCWRDTPT